MNGGWLQRRTKRGAREPDRRTATAILRALEVSRK